MKRNAAFPYVLIMALGIVLIVALSVIGLNAGNEEAGADGKGEEETVALTPEEIYTEKGCISCHGENYEGKAGPELAGVDSRLSADEIKEVLTNGRGMMPGGLVPEDRMDEMVEWVQSLE